MSAAKMSHTNGACVILAPDFMFVLAQVIGIILSKFSCRATGHANQFYTHFSRYSAVTYPLYDILLT